MSILRCINVNKVYKSGENRVHALNHIQCEFDDGKMTAIIGPSGSGKTTLLNILGGLDTPDEGQVLFDNEDILQLNEKKLTQYRRESIGFVFQNYSLLENLTVRENVALPQLLHKKYTGRTSKGEAVRQDEIGSQDWIDELIHAVGLEDKRAARVNELSGGQKQRVAIARALVNMPKIFLCDEPTGNLDVENSKKMIELLRTLNQKYNITIIVVTHNLDIAKSCDTIFEIEDGNLKKS